MTDENVLVLKRTEGYLYKKGGAVNKGIGGRRNWLKRWFVLEKSMTGRNRKENYTLHYFESQKGKQKGSVDLEGTEVFCERKPQHTNKNVKYEFQIQLQNGSVLQLSSDDYQERDEWIESLNYAITSLRKPVVERPTFIKVNHAGYDPNRDDMEENYVLGQEIAQHCQAYGSGLYGAEAGQPAEFMIQVCDPDGNQLTTGGLPFTANLYDDICLYHIGVHDNSNGTLSAFYVLSRPGSYELSIMLNDEHHIYGSPFNVEVLPSHTDPSNCIAHGECLQKSIAPDVPSSFTIIAMDSYGNKKLRGGDPFEVGVMGPAKLLGLEDKGDGTYLCSLEASYPRDQPYITSSSISVIITLNGKPIQGSPFRPTIDLSSRSNQQQQRLQNHNGAPSSNKNIPPNGASSGMRPQLSEKDSSATTLASASANPPRPPLNIPPGTNKLEAARMKALDAVKDLPSMPLDQHLQQQPTARSTQDRSSGYESSGSLSRQRNSTPSSNPSLNRLGKSESTNNSEPKAVPASSSTSRLDQTLQSSLGATGNSGGGGAGGTKLSSRISRLDQMAQKIGTSKLFQSQNQNSAPGTAANSSGGVRRNVPPPPPPLELIDALSTGLVIAPPENLPNELRRLWSITHEALRSREIVNLLASNAVALQSSFNLASEPPAYRLSFLVSETGHSSGLYKLFEEFDVIPAYMNKKELKILFELISTSQSHSGPPPASFVSSQGKEGLEFVFFLKLLTMVAMHCLSKTPAFSSLYSSPKAKTDVMLFNWGFADPLKIRSIQDRLSRGE